MQKRFLTALGFCFLIITTHLLHATVFLVLVSSAYLITNSSIPQKLYFFIFTVTFLFLSPFLIHSILNAASLFYSFVSYYSIYKLIHYFIEVNKNSKFKRSAEEFLFYILFFPCLCHGPIERINNLILDRVKKEDLLFGIKKIVWALIKLNFYVHVLKNLEQIDLPVIVLVYLHAISFYLQLSADWDIVIGASRLLGVRLHENFPRNPFFQPNLTKFWRSCHATLIDWYFSYFYIPLAKNNKSVNVKLVSVFVIIIGMHAFFNTTVLPSISVLLYYMLMGAWFGITLVISKNISTFFKKKKIKLIVSQCPQFIFNIVYGHSIIIWIMNVIINFNIFAFGLWYSPFYKIITAG